MSCPDMEVDNIKPLVMERMDKIGLPCAFEMDCANENGGEDTMDDQDRSAPVAQMMSSSNSPLPSPLTHSTFEVIRKPGSVAFDGAGSGQPVICSSPFFSYSRLESYCRFSSRIFSIVQSPFLVIAASSGKPDSARNALRVCHVICQHPTMQCQWDYADLIVMVGSEEPSYDYCCRVRSRHF